MSSELPPLGPPFFTKPEEIRWEDVHTSEEEASPTPPRWWCGVWRNSAKHQPTQIYPKSGHCHYCELWLQKEEEWNRANRWETTAGNLRAEWIKEQERTAEKDTEIERLKANLEHLQILYMKLASPS
jgi:hypothetical protein